MSPPTAPELKPAEPIRELRPGAARSPSGRCRLGLLALAPLGLGRFRPAFDARSQDVTEGGRLERLNVRVPFRRRSMLETELPTPAIRSPATHQQSRG